MIPIPVCDLARPAAATALIDALAGSGCAHITGHGVDPATVTTMRAVSDAFFDLPPEVKAEARWPGTGLWRGWQPVHEGGAEYGGSAGPTELLERLEENLCPSAGGPDNAENRWPRHPAELRPAWEAYHEALFALTGTVIRLLAHGLALPDADLPAWCEQQFSNLVANHYPAQLEPPEPGRVRVAPHTDHGGLTILHVDDAPGGLEVAGPDGAWRPVRAVPDAFLLQAGDLLERWTAGRVYAGQHRVVNPPPGTGPAGRRLSLVYFHHPRLDAVVTAAGADSGRYPPVVAGDYVAGRQDAYRREGPARAGTSPRS